MEKDDKSTPEESAIVDRANELIDSWNESYDAARCLEAAEIAVEGIKEVCALSVDAPQSQSQIYYGLRILLNALRDIANLKILTTHELWLSVPKAVDQAWDLAHDTRKRLAALRSGPINSEFLAFCGDCAKDVIDAVIGRYGPGLYNSWEMEFDGLTCSLCNADIRDCDHVPGRWYDGKLCQCSPVGGQIVATALVDNPHDPRCRIWPWLLDEENGVIYDVPIFIMYDEAGDEDGGRVINEVKTFPSVCTILNIPATRTKYEVYAYRKLKRRELIDTVRKCIKQHELTSPRNCRIRFHTLIGSGHCSARRGGGES